MERVEINVITGDRVTIPLTAEEIAAAQSAAQAEAIAKQPKSIDKHELYDQAVADGIWPAMKVAIEAGGLTDRFANSIRFNIDDADVMAMATALNVDLQDFFNRAAS